VTSAEDDSAARTTVPTEARTATHGPLEALVPQRAISLPPSLLPRPARREAGVFPLASPPALPRLGSPSPSPSPPPVLATLLAPRRRKALPSVPGFGYNPHSL